ncbi:tripartite motif-containing protein 2-like [Crassostrea angulata]|uniref:tripartite motif-containing protein 2-like n=1 Tax=Magallana angulata TaxID=2784310 RepID=UPI0022B08829|nr:tripartite motif-containing protein 2-like [Crassostrea angulata]
MVSSISSIYKQKKDEVTARGEEWHKEIEKTVKKLHQELDDMQKEHEALLKKQETEYKGILKNLDQINRRATSLQKSNDVKEMQTFIPMIEKQKTLSEFTQYSFPTFCEAYTDDNKVWMGGNTKELKLFDLQGHLHRTVSITYVGSFIYMLNKQVGYIDENKRAVKIISNSNNDVTIFTTGDWNPRGITSTASGDLLVCLYKDNQSKVVRYSSTGGVLQEIQYDSLCQPIYSSPYYITENVNGDIIVTDWKKNSVIAVNRLGILRFSYSKEENIFFASAVVHDSFGHVIIADYRGDKIHLLDRDGQFLRYIIPREGIKSPRALCIMGHGEMIVGEGWTGNAKKIKYLK